MNSKIKKLSLLIGDLVFLHFALFLTLELRYGTSLLESEWTNHWPKFIFVFLIWLLSLYLSGFYNLNLRSTSRRFFRRLGNAALLAVFVSVIYFYIATETAITPKTNLLIFFVAFSLLFIFWRRLSSFVFASLAKEKIAIIGTNDKEKNLIQEIAKNPGAGYEVALQIGSPEEINELAKLIEEKNIRSLVLCDDFGKSEAISKALFSCLNLNINFYSYPDFYESLSGKVPVEAIDADWFLENIKEGNKNYFNAIKGVFDFCLALFILIVTIIFWPIIMLIIKAESKGPAFFKQARLGQREKEFMMIKFRTMREEGNDKTMTAEGDKRITRFGNILRKTRLDEIPQVINVLRGEMSFIGPRPERPEFVVELEKQIPFYKTRLLVKPGLSGWDQVSGEYHSPSAEDTLKKLQNDLFYIKNRSLYLDLIIILKTIAAVLGREGR